MRFIVPAYFRLWVHGLVAAAVGGALSTLGQVLVTPSSVEFTAMAWRRYAATAAAGALIAVLAYFKQSPVKNVHGKC